MNLYVGMDLGGSNTRVVGIKEDGQIAYSDAWPNPAGGGLECLEKGIRFVESNFGNKAVNAMGISISGAIKRDGSLTASNLTDLNGLNLANIARKFGLAEDAFENDVRSALRHLARFGLAREISDCVLLSLGTGIGGAIMVDRKIVKGWSNAAGEFGNMATQSAKVDVAATYEYLVSQAEKNSEAYKYHTNDPRDREHGLVYSSPDFLKLLATLIVGVKAALDPEKIFLMSSSDFFCTSLTNRIREFCADIHGYELAPIEAPVYLPDSSYVCAAGAATRRLELHHGLKSI